MKNAQNVERSHRFKIAFKIALPFIAIIAFLSYIFFKTNNISSKDIILFTLLTFCYVYFTTYMIYQSFKDNVLDSVVGVFHRKKIIEIISKKIKKYHENDNLILLNFKNIDDISQRYGLNFGDEILRKGVEKLIYFLEKNKIKDSIIGRYSGGYFLIFANANKAYITHILNIFSKKIQNDGINDVEIKTNFSLIDANYSKDLKNSINFLLNDINGNEYSHNNINEYENEVCKNIDDSNFIFKTQKIISLNDDSCLYSVVPILKTNNFGKISKSIFMDIANKNGYEITLDKNIFSEFFKKVTIKENEKFILDVSAVSIRNNTFLNFLKDFIEKNNIDPKNIIFEFNEHEIYTHIKRFDEIIKMYKKLGFSFAISHFGGKNSFFTYFLNLKIDYIIYDISISKNYEKEKIKNVFLKFNEICKKLGIKSIIKFVEKAEVLEFAKENKVDFVQGFFIEKPKEV
ncbi:EAL domain-containing protein [Campylobacter pinnipediorum]|uniref:EAL domain-containing protein n=1 Tax=Campylobacter pinnipediorum TaxID=1965231 RepID=UPI00084DC918|nr:EAL domain-containing protein [Campylobacter pinnipediorum]